MGQKPVPSVNIPVPTCIGSKMGGEFTYQPKWDPMSFDNHSHFGPCITLPLSVLTEDLPFAVETKGLQSRWIGPYKSFWLVLMGVFEPPEKKFSETGFLSRPILTPSLGSSQRNRNLKKPTQARVAPKRHPKWVDHKKASPGGLFLTSPRIWAEKGSYLQNKKGRETQKPLENTTGHTAASNSFGHG